MKKRIDVIEKQISSTADQAKFSRMQRKKSQMKTVR